MGVMMLVVLVAIVAGGVALGLAAVSLGRNRLTPPMDADSVRLVREQAERIDALEAELRRLQEQADFTERLLSERGETKPPELPPESSED